MRKIAGLLVFMISFTAQSAQISRLHCDVTSSSGEQKAWHLWLELSSRPQIVTIKERAIDQDAITIVVTAKDEYIVGNDQSTDYVTWRDRIRQIYIDRYSLELEANFEEWTDEYWIRGEDSVKEPRMVSKETFSGICRRLEKQV